MKTGPEKGIADQLANTADFLRKSRLDVAHKLIDGLAPIALSLTVLVFGISAFRIINEGYNFGYYADIVLTLVFAGLLLLRHRIPVLAQIFVMIMIVAIDGLIMLTNSQLLGPSYLALGALCIVMGVFFGFRASLFAIAGVVAATAIVGTLTCMHLLDSPSYSLQNNGKPVAWVARALVFIFYITGVSRLVSEIHNRLSKSLESLSIRSNELSQVVEDLGCEIETRKLTEQKLVCEEARYRLLAENLRDVLFIQDMNFKIQYISPSVQNVFGYTPQEALGLDPAKFLTPQSLPTVMDAFQHYTSLALQGKKSVMPLFEFEYIHKNGTTVSAELSVVFLYDDKEQPIGSQGLLRDISDRKKAEKERTALQERLRQSEKLEAIGMLAGGIAHDFNNQLAGIMGNANLIRIEAQELPLIMEMAQAIEKSAERAADLTGKLLTFARKTPHQSVSLDLHTVINEAIALLKRSIDKKIEIASDFLNESLTVWGDPALLQNVFLNLGINARDAMPNGGVLRFQTSVATLNSGHKKNPCGLNDGAYAKIQVIDSGIGMDHEIVKHVFEPFFTTKEVGKGTGMGLSIVYATIESHKGGIEVASRLSQGTTFSLYLPFSSAAAVNAVLPKDNQNTLSAKASIMVVEDDATVSMIIGKSLQKMGHEPVIFSNPARAIEYFQQNAGAIDLCLIDMIMPDMNGKDLFRALQQIKPSVAVLIVSGYSDNKEIQHILTSGARGFLKKPFFFSDLSKSIGEALTPGPRAA